MSYFDHAITLHMHTMINIVSGEADLYNSWYDSTKEIQFHWYLSRRSMPYSESYHKTGALFIYQLV